MRTTDSGLGGGGRRRAAAHPTQGAMIPAVLAVGLVFALGACQSGVDSGTPSTSIPMSPGNSAGGALAAGAYEAKMWMSRPELPIDYYADLVDLAYARVDEIAAGDGGTWEVEQEDFIATCMRGEGFEYFPREIESPAEGYSVLEASDHRLWIPWLPEELEDVERLGYGYLASEGVTTLVEASAEPDANAQYVASLSSAAQKEYQVAMLGAELAEYDLADIASVPLPEMGGCAGEASKLYPYPYGQALESSPTTLYEDLINQMRDEAGSPYSLSFLRRAELDVLDAEWRECFERSFPPLAQSEQASDPDAPVGLPGDEPAEPTESNGPTGAWDLAVSTDSDGNYWAGQGERPVEYSSLTGTEREVAIAVADYKCRQDSDYVDRFLAVERAAQEEFIANHKSELDRMAAALQDFVSG